MLVYGKTPTVLILQKPSWSKCMCTISRSGSRVWQEGFIMTSIVGSYKSEAQNLGSYRYLMTENFDVG